MLFKARGSSNYAATYISDRPFQNNMDLLSLIEHSENEKCIWYVFGFWYVRLQSIHILRICCGYYDSVVSALYRCISADMLSWCICCYLFHFWNEWVSKKILNGTSAQIRLFSAIRGEIKSK